MYEYKKAQHTTGSLPQAGVYSQPNGSEEHHLFTLVQAFVNPPPA